MSFTSGEKNLKKLSIVIITLVMVIIVTGVISIYSITNLETKARTLTLQSRIEEYKLKVDGAIGKDLEMLSSIAPFFSEQDNLKNLNFLRQFINSNNANIFVRMGYVSLDGSITKVYKGDTTYENAHIRNGEPEIIKILEQAFKGDKVVSEIFIDKRNNQKSIGLAVPVDNNGKTVGALVGTYPISVFGELLKKDSKENVDLIQKDGTFVVFSEQSLADENDGNIFLHDTYSEKEKEYIRQQMNDGKSFEVTYTVAGKNHLSRYTPVDNSDLYLIYSDTTNRNLDNIYFWVHFMQIVFGILILIIVITILYLYKEIVAKQKKFWKIAFYDSLTNAFNFFKFQEEVNKSPSNIKCVAKMNISGFRYINAEFGRRVADKLLITIVRIIKENLRENEFCGKEFADTFWIAFTDGDEEIVKKRLEKIVSVIEEECQPLLNGYKVSFFIGVAFIGDYRIDLIERARFSLRESREKNHDNITIWTENEEKHLNELLYVESQKENALRNGEFKMYLQPKKNYKTGEIDSAEVLVRWIKPNGEIILPDQFIHHFEENGFCVQLDLYMFEQACKTLRKWIDENKKEMRLSINQSKLLFFKDGYVDMLCEITDKYRINPNLLTLEILENLSMYNLDRLNHVIQNLREKGFLVSIDDFGSGYSSLNSVGSLKVNEIKLDRHFIKELDEEKNYKILIDKLVKTMKLLNISVVVEGIETVENEEFVQSIQADYGQGYYYNKPISLEVFEKQYI